MSVKDLMPGSFLDTSALANIQACMCGTGIVAYLATEGMVAGTFSRLVVHRRTHERTTLDIRAPGPGYRMPQRRSRCLRRAIQIG